MKAAERNETFDKLRYEMRMAEGLADEAYATRRCPTLDDVKVIIVRLGKALALAEKLQDGLSGKDEGLPF